jgi:hypothetical protein
MATTRRSRSSHRDSSSPSDELIGVSHLNEVMAKSGSAGDRAIRSAQWNYRGAMAIPVCAAALPFEPGPRLAGATCQRTAEHPGPHCWREADERTPVMWSGDGSPIVSSEGSMLVHNGDLTDADGTVWTYGNVRICRDDRADLPRLGRRSLGSVVLVGLNACAHPGQQADLFGRQPPAHRAVCALVVVEVPDDH